MVGQQQVEHRGLVDDGYVGGQGVGLVDVEAVGAGLELEQAVDGHGLGAGGLGEALGRAAGGGCEGDA